MTRIRQSSCPDRAPGNGPARRGGRGVGRMRCMAASISLMTLGACSPLGSLPALNDPPRTVYRLGPGDRIRVVTYNDPQLSNSFQVGEGGTIAFPLVGNVPTQGQTPDELAATLVQDLSERGLLHHPSVSVEVAAYRPIFVLGEVARPGQYEYQPGMTADAAIALAGGFTYRAIRSGLGDVRTEGTPDGKPVMGKVNARSLLAPGDVLTVYERYF